MYGDAVERTFDTGVRRMLALLNEKQWGNVFVVEGGIRMIRITGTLLPCERQKTIGADHSEASSHEKQQ